jgi:hypothetical protein
MGTREEMRGLPLALLLIVITTPLSDSWQVPTAVAAGNNHRPVLFLHGYSSALCPGSSGTAYFGTMINFLRNRGFDQDMVPVGYYGCDTDVGVTLANFGSKGQGALAQNADIRQLAYQLAWMIYTNYSRRRIQVDVVAHSMGGLIVRSMLNHIQAGDPSFPNVLLVPEVVTLGTPHAGAEFAAYCGNAQCQDMAPHSQFLAELNRNPLAPQGTGGTDWTIFGSVGDLVVTEASALHMGHVHKVDYLEPAYDHGGYLSDTSVALSASVIYWKPNDTKGQSLSSAPHALEWVGNALQGAQP